MPRKSFSDVQKGGVGFQEGRVFITESIATVYQFPPNSTTGVQSDPFTALLLLGHRLDKDGNEMDGEQNEVEIPIRMGNPGVINPGFIDPKDFDNLNVEAKDLGKDLNTKGNSFCFIDPSAKFNRAWSSVEEGLKKHGFKPELLGRCITTDFQGMDISLKTVEGQKYIAKAGRKKGEEVIPTSLEVERIWAFPWDQKKPGKQKTTTQPAAPVAGAAATTAPAAPANGSINVIEVAKTVFSNLTPKFIEAVPVDKAVKRADFQKALTMELMRQKIDPVTTKALMDAVKDDAKLIEVAGETEKFTTDGQTVTFV